MSIFRGRADRRQQHRMIGLWLLCVAAMIFVMVVLGGVTRLTESGLSMVDWRPVTGWLPPIGDEAWQATFDAYRQSPQYNKINQGMTVAEFRGIFWLEYLHRLWGRLIGLAFLVPMLAFLFRGWVNWGLGVRLTGLFVLGGAQGGLGWWMVKSGLVDDPAVSPYRLAAHLGLAVVIFGLILQLALRLVQPDTHPAPEREVRGLRRFATFLTVWVFLTILSGALVAGHDAGLTYNTFPLMDGRLIPDGLAMMTPGWRNLFENITTVQFDHRVMATATVLFALAFWWRARRVPTAKGQEFAASGLAIMALVQAGLGIATLLLVVPVPLAAAHQAGAMVLFSLAIVARHRLRSHRPID